MTWWEGIVLGVVQGLTEFLPVSSSGHLVLAEAVLGVTLPGLTVEVAVHVATLLAVFVVYGARGLDVVRAAIRGDHGGRRYLGLLLVASVPAGVAGIGFRSAFERSFESPAAAAAGLVLTGLILWSTRRAAGRANAETLSYPGAFAIGVAQAAAILPGVSRSGSTVATALWLGVAPVRAAEFSFLMSIPAILGAAVLQLPELSASEVAQPSLALAFVTALVVGVGAIKVLIRILERGAFYRFAPYCWAIGLVTGAWLLLAR